MKSILLAAMFVGCDSSAVNHQTVHNHPPSNPNQPTVTASEGGSPYSYLALATIAVAGAIRLAVHAKKKKS